MRNTDGSPNSKTAMKGRGAHYGHSTFDIDSTFVIRHSSF